MKKRYLHLDFKGIVPRMPELKKYLQFFHDCGFDGVVLEFDCRLSYKTFPGTGMPLFSTDEAKEIVKFAELLGFETIPLMQIHGHLEWLLGDEKYASLRENGKLTLCPSNPESLKKLGEWMRELREIFPRSEYIHLGADEVTAIGECPLCAPRMEKEGKAGIYTAHVVKCCKMAAGLGFRPLIWADMLLKEFSCDAVRELPADVIIVDWQYWGAGPYPTTEKLQKSGREVWGASAVRSAWYEHPYSILNFPEDRLENVSGWNHFDGNVIHTCWGRPGNKWNLYPPWILSLPVFIAAGNPQKWAVHPWKERYEKLNTLLRRNLHFEVKKTLDMLGEWEAETPFEKEFLHFLKLGIRFQLLIDGYLEYLFSKRMLESTAKFVGRDDFTYQSYIGDYPAKLQKDHAELMADIADGFDRCQFSDKEEYIAEKTAVFDCLEKR